MSNDDVLTVAYMKGLQDGKDAAEGLDELLDSVHPKAKVSMNHIMQAVTTDPDDYWLAHVRVPVGGFVGSRMYEGTGLTRMAAIRDAVRKVREASQ